MFGAKFLGKRDILKHEGITLAFMHILKKLERCVARMYVESRFLAILYRGISSGGSWTAGKVFGCFEELTSGEPSCLFLLLLAMLTMMDHGGVRS